MKINAGTNNTDIINNIKEPKNKKTNKNSSVDKNFKKVLKNKDNVKTSEKNNKYENKIKDSNESLIKKDVFDSTDEKISRSKITKNEKDTKVLEGTKNINSLTNENDAELVIDNECASTIDESLISNIMLNEFDQSYLEIDTLVGSFEDIKIIEEDFSDVDMQTLVSLLLLTNNKETINEYGISKEKFEFYFKEIKSGKSFDEIIQSEGFKLQSSKVVNFEKIEKLLGNISKKIESLDTDDAKSILSSKSDPVKDIIIKALNSKGVSNEEIKSFNMKLKSSNSVSEEIKIDILSNSDIYKNNSKFQSSDSSQEDGFADNKKEDNFLSKIVLEDENTNNFDLGIQRIKNFSVISNENKTPSVNRFTMKTDLNNIVSNMTKNNLKELVVKVNPGNLGEVSIKIVSESDSMKAIIKFSSKETYSLINTQEIKQYLNTENIKISDVEISLYNDDTTFFGDESAFMNEEKENEKYEKSNADNDYIDLDDETNENAIASLDIII